jgi:hypothetical protein
LPSVVQEGRALPGSRKLVQTKTWRSNFANQGSLNESSELILREFLPGFKMRFSTWQDGVDWQFCDNRKMDMLQDSLLSLKDDMVAFIAGHGMRRVPVYVGEEVPTVVWEDESNADSWKDFVETAKAAGAAFVTMSEVVLEKDDLELLLEELQETNFPDEESPLIDEAQSLATHVGRVGYIQLGFAHQGVVFLHENTTAWYERYQQLLESLEGFGDIVLNDEDADEQS